MKLSSILASALAVFALAGVPTLAYAQNPGIVVAGSQKVSSLPQKARTFLNKHFKNVPVAKCEQYFAKGKYEVELSNGVDIDFDTKGNVLEVDAPGASLLAPSVVKSVIPSKAYDRLVADGLTDNVEGVSFEKGRLYEIDLNIAGPDTYIFDINGNFIAIED